jgi:hypothetical protein
MEGGSGCPWSRLIRPIIVSSAPPTMALRRWNPCSQMTWGGFGTRAADEPDAETEFVKSFEMAARLHTRLEGSYQARKRRRFVSASIARFACDDLYGAGGRGPAVVCEGSHGVTGSDSSYKESGDRNSSDGGLP